MPTDWDLIEESLGDLTQGISVVDGDLRLVYFNRAFVRLLGYPDRFVKLGMHFEEFIRYNAERGEYGAGDVEEQIRVRVEKARHTVAHRFERARPDGTVIEVIGRPLTGGGFVTTYTDVTERHRMEDRLRREKAFSDKVVESLPGIFYLFDANGRMLRWNSNLEKTSGYGGDDIWRMPPIEFIDEDDRPAVSQAIVRVMTEGEAQIEALLKTKDGRPIPFVFSGQRVTVGDMPGVVGVGMDISGRRDVEQQLRTREERYRTIVDTTSEGFWRIDPQGRTTEINPALASILGRLSDEVMGKRPLDFVHPDHRNDFLAHLRQLPDVLQGRIETTFLRPDGKVAHVRLNSTRLRPINGVQQGAFAFVTDLTREKKSQEAMQLSKAVFAAAGEAIVVTDAGNRIIATNPAFSEITGYTPEEAAGRNPSFLSSGWHDAGFFRDMWAAINAHGRWQGEIWNRRKNGELYPEWLSVTVVRDREGKVVRHIGIFTDISERKRAEETIQRQASCDTLTQLPNRAVFYDRLQMAQAQADRDERLVALHFIDLDFFKDVNDSQGHSVGDALLKDVAVRLQSSIRRTDTVARLGGDEFAVIQTSIRHVDDAAALAEKMLSCFREPFIIDDRRLFVSASIGITIYPIDDQGPEQLLRDADIAMYAAKDKGRNTFEFYSANMGNMIRARNELEQDLRHAVDSGQIYLDYQPKIDADSGQMMGVEALVRWRHPTRGIIAPIEFIPLAEKCGLIIPLGEWVLRQACRQQRAWVEAGLPPLEMAVNLSAVQFRAGGLVEMIEKVIAETGIPPHQLELEITESTAMYNAGETALVLDRLTALGVKVSLDDFGTGYSSLAYLKRFPLNRVKIDRSFVLEVTSSNDDAAIVSAVVSMGSSMNMRVTAEGVETEGQLNFLREQGCHEVQGYLFSRPVAPDAIGMMLRSGTMPGYERKRG